MGRTTEYLDGKSRLNTARALFQVPDVLLFGFADATQRRAEANAHSILRLFAGILDTRVFQRELCRYDRELRVPIQPFQSVR